MVEFTKNELNILDLALKNKKYVISRQDDMIRDNMLLYLCKKVVNELHSQGKKGNIMVVTDDFKYDKIKKRIDNYNNDGEIILIKKNDFVKETNDKVYDCLIYDNLQNLVKNSGNEPNITDIKHSYNINKMVNKDFMFYSFYDGFLRDGVLDIYVVMMIYYYNYLLINKLSEPKDFLNIMMEINYKGNTTYGDDVVMGINISKMLVDKIKSLVGFDDYRNIDSIDNLIEINKEGIIVYSNYIEISDIDKNFFRLANFYDYIIDLIENMHIYDGNFIDEMLLPNKIVLTKEKYIIGLKRIIDGDPISNPIYQFTKLLELDNNLIQYKIINKYNAILEYAKKAYWLNY